MVKFTRMMKFISDDNKHKFKSDSVLLIKNLFDKNTCNKTVKWLEKNEIIIIKKFKKDKKGLVSEFYNGKECIKYFEHPLFFCPKLFSNFMSSKIFKYASELLDSEVIFQSLEIHSRFPGSELIPMHQDNAYYGLDNGRALTFYIPINAQNASLGGLSYLAIEQSSEVYEHVPSKSSGFSLEVKNKEDVLKKHQKKLFNFEPGDCSIHYSNSIHYAKEVPCQAKRCWVVRFSFYSCEASIKSGHNEWYQKMIDENRSHNEKN